jgi:hypothetical protein
VASRALPILLLLAAAPAPAGDAGPESDPFLAALAGRSGPDAVAAPDFDPDTEALSWTLRPRREIVDALAARLLRGEVKSWSDPAGEGFAFLGPPSRFPADFEPGKLEVTDRLAARIPADAAAAFFGSLEEAEVAVDQLSGLLPRVFPELCGEPQGGKRNALQRAMAMLLLPTIWGSNPGARTGIRQVAVVVSDPDLRWAPDIAVLAEVDDADLVRFHRRSTLSWEDRGLRRMRVDGLDVVSDDGSVLSFFALEGGMAVWSTTRALRTRILETNFGRMPSLLSPPSAAYALARRTFPAKEGGALLVVPDGFLVRADAPEFRARRAQALRCEAARLLLDARILAGAKDPMNDTVRLRCPSGGVFAPVANGTGSSCSVHGTVSSPVPLGDVPPVPPGEVPALALSTGRGHPVGDGGLPLAARWNGSGFEVFISPKEPGRHLWNVLAGLIANALGDWRKTARMREQALSLQDPGRGDPLIRFRGLSGLDFDGDGSRVPPLRRNARPREQGGVLRIQVDGDRSFNGVTHDLLLFEWL